MRTSASAIRAVAIAVAFLASSGASIGDANAAEGGPTTTSLSTPSSVADNMPISLTATVSGVEPMAPARTVQFRANGLNLGTPVAVGADGVATRSVYRPQGQHVFTAVFTPTDPAAFTGSSSAAVTTLVTPYGDDFGDDTQYIRGQIPIGTAIITTPYTEAQRLNLGTLALNAPGSMFTASAAFEDIHIIDTLAGNRPWAASAVPSHLTNSATGVINSQNVGLTNLVPTYFPGNALQAITVINRPAANPAVGPADAGTQGLGNAPHEIAHANYGAGTVEIDGLPTLNAPSSTQAGTYSGKDFFTIAGS